MRINIATLGEIETEHPGYLVAQDTYYIGTIKGIGKIYQQTVLQQSFILIKLLLQVPMYLMIGLYHSLQSIT